MTPLSDSQVVFIVDDDVSVQRGLSRLIRSAGIETQTFSSAEEFLAAGLAARPGCLIIDLRMPGMNGLELQRSLAAQGHAIPVIFVSGESSIPDTVEAIKGGAVDFIAKPFADSQLLAAIFQALYKDANSRSARSEEELLRQRYELLTPREKEVCCLVAEGLLNKQVGFKMGVSEKTVKIHRARVMDKLNVRSLPELVRLVDRIVTKPELKQSSSNG
jgi:FixJ family two-component response regulator